MIDIIARTRSVIRVAGQNLRSRPYRPACTIGLMALWDYLFDSEYKQRSDISTLQASTGAAAAQSGRTAQTVHSLRRRVDQQDLLIEALFRIVKDKGLAGDVEIRETIAQIDLEDGVEDGRIGRDRTKKAPKCPDCERPVSRKRTHCVYCNAALTARK